MDKKRELELKTIADNLRIDALNMVNNAQSGHIGGSLSVIDILTALYFEVMNIDPANPHWEDRDRFVLSKGHCTPALYSVLAKKGYFPKADLKTFRQIDSYLSGHAEMNKVPGVDMSTGSLGQGLSAACGMAIAGKLDQKTYKVYAVLGDGEIQEGQIWEAAMAAAKYKLDNLTAIIDNNDLQIDGYIDEVMPLGSIKDKFTSFGWNALVVDGHDFNELVQALTSSKEKEKPTVIIAKTIKGKGVSFMEDDVAWHGSVPSKPQYRKASEELKSALTRLKVML